jgi:transposase
MMKRKNGGYAKWLPVGMGLPTGFFTLGSWPAVGMASGWKLIAKALNCSSQTVCRRLHRFDGEGIEGLGDRPKAGRPRRLTTEDDSRIIALARSTPPGKLERQVDGSLDVREEQGVAQWSLDALTQAANEAGIQAKRSQIRRICFREGVRWRRTHSWGESSDKDFAPKE